MKINELQKIQKELYQMQEDQITKFNYKQSRRIGQARIAIRDIIIKLFH